MISQIKRCKRVGRQNYWTWLEDLQNWTTEQLINCWLLAEKAWISKSIRAQYTANIEMNDLKNELNRRHAGHELDKKIANIDT